MRLAWIGTWDHVRTSHGYRLKSLLEPLLPAGRFGPRERALTLTMWLVGFIQGFTQAQPAASLPFTRAGLGLSQAEMSSLLAWARLGSLLALALSIWADRAGRRRPLLASYALLVLASVSAGFAATPAAFGISQAMVRGATTGLSSLGVVWLAEHLAPTIRAYGVAIYGAAGSFGAALAVLALPLAQRDWRLAYWITGAGLILLPVLVRRMSEGDKDHVRSHQPLDTTFIRTRVFRLAAGASFLPAAFSALGLSFLTERLVTEIGFSPGYAVVLTLVGGTLGGVGFFLGGRLADSWGRRPTTILALAAILTGGMGLFHLRTVPWVLASLVVSSFGSFAYVPAASIHRAELFPRQQRATASGALNWVGTVGSAAGLLTGGLIIERLGLTGAMEVLGVGVLLAAVLTSVLPETREGNGARDQYQETSDQHGSDRPPDSG